MIVCPCRACQDNARSSKGEWARQYFSGSLWDVRSVVTAEDWDKAVASMDNDLDAMDYAAKWMNMKKETPVENDYAKNLALSLKIAREDEAAHTEEAVADRREVDRLEREQGAWADLLAESRDYARTGAGANARALGDATQAWLKASGMDK